MNNSTEALAKACCADLYQSDLARMILGESLHPGGLALTNRLGRLMGIRRNDLVVDLAAGRGVSAMAVSRAFHCRVVGLEYGRAAALQAAATAQDAPAPPQADFLQADAEHPPLVPGRFDGVLCECSLSIFPNKSLAVEEIRRLLRPGGVVGISDVTVEPGCLPEELEGTVGQVLCLCGALNADGYRRLLEEGGLILRQEEDASHEALRLLEELEGKLSMVTAFRSLLGEDASEIERFRSAPELLAMLKELVYQGKLGYWLFVAENPL